MAFDAHKNFAYSLVATAPSPATSGTSLVVSTGDGTKFPSVPFNAVIWPVNAQPTAANAEIVRVTAISTDTFTITRTQESTSARTVIVGDQISANITAKLLTDIEAFLTGSSQIPWQSLPAGTIVQMVDSLTNAFATGTTIIPFDDTIPQNTEGDQYMSVAITPLATTNKLVIEVLFFGSTSVGNEMIVALFQDTTANALAADSQFNATATARESIYLSHSMVAGTTSATTFKVRAGSAIANTTTFNGNSGGREFGAVTHSSIRIWEVKV